MVPFSKTIKDIEDILIKKPNYLMVQGDTNTAFAGCFASSIYNRKFFDNKKKLNYSCRGWLEIF